MSLTKRHYDGWENDTKYELSPIITISEKIHILHSITILSSWWKRDIYNVFYVQADTKINKQAKSMFLTAEYIVEFWAESISGHDTQIQQAIMSGKYPRNNLLKLVMIIIMFLSVKKLTQ